MRASRSRGTSADHCAGAVGEVHRREFLERRGPEDERTEVRRAGQVVPDAVARRVFAVAGPLLLRIETET